MRKKIRQWIGNDMLWIGYTAGSETDGLIINGLYRNYPVDFNA
jgi:hypothetical protein